MTRFHLRGRHVLLAAGLAACCAPVCAPVWAQTSDATRPVDKGADGLSSSAGAATLVQGEVSAGEGDRLRQLLLRPEVQTHLKLTVRQKNDLGLVPPPAKKNGAKSGAATGPSGSPAPVPPGDDLPGAGGRVAIVVRPGEGDTLAATPEERQQRAEALLGRLREQIAADGQARLATIKETLTPEQYARLLELDVQRRGPLALADPAVAERVKLDSAKRAPVAALAREAQDKMARATSEALRGQDEGDTPIAPGARLISPDRIEKMRRDMKNKLSPLRQKTDKAKKDAEEQILALLSDEEKQRWQDAQGEPFTFRTDR